MGSSIVKSTWWNLTETGQILTPHHKNYFISIFNSTHISWNDSLEPNKSQALVSVRVMRINNTHLCTLLVFLDGCVSVSLTSKKESTISVMNSNPWIHNVYKYWFNSFKFLVSKFMISKRAYQSKIQVFLKMRSNSPFVNLPNLF